MHGRDLRHTVSTTAKYLDNQKIIKKLNTNQRNDNTVNTKHKTKPESRRVRERGKTTLKIKQALGIFNKNVPK
jgi:hypothetical protein